MCAGHMCVWHKCHGKHLKVRGKLVESTLSLCLYMASKDQNQMVSHTWPALLCNELSCRFQKLWNFNITLIQKTLANLIPWPNLEDLAGQKKKLMVTLTGPSSKWSMKRKHKLETIKVQEFLSNLNLSEGQERGSVFVTSPSIQTLPWMAKMSGITGKSLKYTCLKEKFSNYWNTEKLHNYLYKLLLFYPAFYFTLLASMICLGGGLYVCVSWFHKVRIKMMFFQT